MTMSITRHDTSAETRLAWSCWGRAAFSAAACSRPARRRGVEAIWTRLARPRSAEPAAQARLAERLRPKDVLVFLAALTPDKGRDSGTLMRNLAMCRAVCEATRGVEIAQLVYASSDAVYSFATASSPRRRRRFRSISMAPCIARAS